MTNEIRKEWRTIDPANSGLVAHHYDNYDDARDDTKRNPWRIVQQRLVSDWGRPVTPTTKEADTPTGPDHLAVGAVIESADDPRIDALPAGSILLDRNEDATTKWPGDWTGAGYIPIEGDGTEYGPWTVLHIPKETDQ